MHLCTHINYFCLCIHKERKHFCYTDINHLTKSPLQQNVESYIYYSAAIMMITTCRLATGVHCLSSKRLWTSLSRWLEEMRVYPIMPCIHPQWQAFISVLGILLSTGKDRTIVSFCAFHSHCECVCVIETPQPC